MVFFIIRKQLRSSSASALRHRVYRWGAAHQHQQPSLLLFQPDRTSRSSAAVTANVRRGSQNEDGSSPYSSSMASSGDPSSSYLAWCAAASVTASICIGLDYHDVCNNRSHARWGNQQVIGVRGYHSTSAVCESNRTNNNDNDGGTSKSDSFFDMAQQWASVYAGSKSREIEKEAESTEKINGPTIQSDEPSNNIQTPEELLEAMGILGGVSNNKPKTNDNENEDTPDKIIANDDKDDEKEESNNLKGMVKKVLFKFDEFQSSFPKPQSSSLTKEGETKTSNSSNNSSNSSQPNQSSDSSSSSSSIVSEFLSFANNASLFTRKSSDSSSPPDIEELIKQAQSIANHVSSPPGSSSSSSIKSSPYNSSSSGFLSQVLYFQQNAQSIQRAFESSFAPLLSNINAKDIFQSLPLTALHYYLEYQDSIKTPSWKRRIHRFQREVEVSKVEELNEALILSELSYADNVEEIRLGLERLFSSGKGGNKPQWELLFCDTKSRPNQPSHFLAIQKNASPYDDALHVLVVVRGTKSMSDLITDAMMEASEYEYALPSTSDEDDEGNVMQGFAHGGMVQSGKYLVERHRELLSTLLKLSKKRRMEITLIGHSLGAGAATIAAMEWNSKPFGQQQSSNNISSSKSSIESGKTSKIDDVQVSAHVIGFGCPALLSQPLSLATKDYVTTVIADADFIPRMSGATLVNLLLDVRVFDYRKQAERDVEQALRELQSRFFLGSSGDLSLPSSGSSAKSSKSKLAFNIDEEDIQTVMGYVHRGLEKVATTSSPPSPSSSVKETTKEQAEEGNTNKTKEESKEDFKKMQPILFPPGDCVHFYRDGSGISGSYVPCNFFNEIDVARTMIDDHLISSGYRRIFLNLMRDFHKDDHFSFEKQGTN